MLRHQNKKPLLLIKQGFALEGDDRIRTGDKGFADLCLTTWPRRHKKTRQAQSLPFRFEERATRFELVAFSLARRRSTTELRPHTSLLRLFFETYARTQT